MDLLLQEIRDWIAAATQGMSTQELSWHPVGKWSTAEILEHLSLTYSGTRAGCDRCLKEGKCLARSPSLRDRLATLVVVSCGHLPEGRQSPAAARPKGMPAESVLAEIDQKIVAMDERLRMCEERFGGRVKLMDHPILGPLTVQQWRKFHWVHARHHMKQIEALHRPVAAASAGRTST
jgi:Protein of unknown function (DUF1569)